MTTDDLPVLTTIVGETPDGLPTLTEVVAIEELPVLTEAVAASQTDSPGTVPDEDVLPPALSEADMLRLVQLLETHLESAFAQKLGHRLEQLQRLAVEQAIGELRAELPQILHDALHHTNR